MSLRVAFYSHNGFGLGHVARNAKLARALLARKPNADILLITGSAGIGDIPLAASIDYVKLPSVRKQSAGRWRPQALDIEMEHLLKLRRTIVLESIRAYRPHLLVVDFLPLGVERELEPALEELAERKDAHAVVGFRDILDEPQAVREAWELDGSRAALDQLYDRVLVYGEPDWFDFANYGLPSTLPHYVGLLGSPDALPRTRSAAEHRVLVSAGGGADGYPVLAAAFEAVERVREDDGVSLTCTALTGPLMHETDYERLRAIAKRVGGRVRRFADDLPRAISRASAVIGMCGYNTVCDVLSFRRPAVVIPRPGPSREQPIRASILAKRRLANVLPLAEATPRELAASLLDALDQNADRAYPEDELPDLGGVGRAATALLELVE